MRVGVMCLMRLSRSRTLKLLETQKGFHSHDELLATQQRVANELASSQGDGGLGVSHLDDLSIS